MTPESGIVGQFLRYFWILGGVAALLNLMMLRGSVERRVVGQGFAPGQARTAWYLVQGPLVSFALAQFAVQSLGASPEFPLLLLFPEAGPFATAAFSIAVAHYLVIVGLLWLHPLKLVLAATASQGLVAPGPTRILVTVGGPALFVVLFISVRAAS
jgi:hypothetical protein